ncbi:glutamate receptor 1-like [Daphnia magna]|uniref:glutamate receptor 1-like n=1 Tax=Daphnia magna TaxID=35525 RepID=UPI0014028135|nr:glutamate receptor 1-like [Daphnia magna]
MFRQLQLLRPTFLVQFVIILSLSVSSAEPLSSLKTRQGHVNNPLADQHLNVLWARRGGEYNSSYIGPKKGGLMVDYLARRFNFTYSFLTVNEIYLYAVGKAKRGLVDYLLDGQCDLLVHDVLLTTENYKTMELTLPWHRSIIVFMVPVPLITTNLDAVIKPFQWPVWTGIGISVITIIFFLKLTDRSPFAMSQTSEVSPSPTQQTEKADEICDHSSSTQTKKEPWNMYLYVFGMLLSQGGSCIRKHWSSRLVAGVWSLATFVFVQAYTSTLFTYIVTPSTAPLLVESVYDVVNKPHIQLVIERGRGFESTIMNTREKTGIFKQLRDKLMAFPKTRCYGASDCVALVKDGPNVVHGNAFVYVADYMINDFKITGKCNFQVARESFWPIIVGFGLQKRSRYTEPINKGILEMWDNGLMNLWESWFRAIPGKCENNFKQVNRSPTRVKTSPLSLKNLAGAFVVLSVGYGLSLLVFVVEHIMGYANRQRDRKRRNNF